MHTLKKFILGEEEKSQHTREIIIALEIRQTGEIIIALERRHTSTTKT